MTEILAILGVAVLFVLYGLMNRGRSRSCGSGCSCGLLSGACERRDANAAPVESEHAER
jgi:hypothetical protein